MDEVSFQGLPTEDFELWEALETGVPCKLDNDVGGLDVQDLSFTFLHDKPHEDPSATALSPKSTASNFQSPVTSSSLSGVTMHKDAPLATSQMAAAATGKPGHSSPGGASSLSARRLQPASQIVSKAAESGPAMSPAGPATPDQSGSGGAACGATVDISGAQSRCPSSQADQPQELDEKARARQMRNRESAAQSRVRKKKFFEELEQRCQQLEHANNQLNVMVQQLTSENASLKCQLASAYSGQPVPQGAGFGVPYGYSYFPAMPQVTPKIPIPAKKPSPSGKRGQSASAGSTLKRTKTSKATSAASAALLSVVCCVLFVASPWGRDGSMSYLPSSNTDLKQDDAALVRSGRVLTALNMDWPESVNLSEDLGAPPQALKAIQSRQDPPDHSPSNSSLPQLVTPSDASLALPVVARPHSEIGEEVMQQLKKLGALALDDNAASPASQKGAGPGGAGSHASFPLMALSIFDHAGLISPVTCTEVVRFRRADNGQSSERQSRPMSDNDTRPYRGSNSFAIPLPPAGAERSHGDQDSSDGPKQRIGEDPDDVQVGTIVSVLFPSRNTTGVSGSSADPNSVGELYVVMLAPQSSYVAYRCDLPYSVEMRI